MTSSRDLPPDAPDLSAGPARGFADSGRFDGLFLLAYERLRGLAEKYLQGERSDHTLRATALVHEAFLRLRHLERRDYVDETHVMAQAANEMRRVLVDHARGKKALRRGAGGHRVAIRDSHAVEPGPSLDLIALHEALTRMMRVHERQARVAELRLFGGLTLPEIASITGVTVRTTGTDWRFARAWLTRCLEPGAGHGG